MLLQKQLANEPLADDDFHHLPACAQACPAKAIIFGDLNDPDSQVTQLARSPRALRLLEPLGTQPKVIYLRGRR
jgi:molybdopterin-containing oxidoreductase family iron-sulfur binding subunit